MGQIFVFLYAAEGGRLRRATENDCLLSNWTFELTAYGGHLSCLQWTRSMNKTGTIIHERVQLKVGISPASNRREIMTAHHTNIRVPMQLLVDISPASNGRERIDFPGVWVATCAAAAEGGHLS